MRKVNMYRLAMLAASGATLMAWGCGWGEGWRAVAAIGVTAVIGYVLGFNLNPI